MYENSTKETKWVCIQLAYSRRPRAFGEAHCWNIQAKFYNEKFPLVYESDKTRDSIIKIMVLLWITSVEKDSNIVSLFLAFLPPFFYWGNALIMMIITLLFIYNSMFTTRYLEQNMSLHGCLRRCTRMGNESRVACMMNMHGGFATNTMSTTWSCKAIWQWWSVS